MIDEEHQVEGMQSSSVNPDLTDMPPEQLRSDEATSEVNADLTGQDFLDSATEAPEESVTGANEAATSEASPNNGVDNIDYSKLAALEAEIQSLKAQVEDRTGQYMRIAADFDNYRKRTQREKEEFEQQIKCSTINELLPVVDNFERARSQIKPQTEQETTIHKSYQSVYKQLVDCLKRIGVAPMRAEGSEFDPALHEAVMRQPTNEFPEGTIIAELQRGYMLGERVLRHALVKVAAPAEPEDGATQETEESGSSG